MDNQIQAGIRMRSNTPIDEIRRRKRRGQAVRQSRPGNKTKRQSGRLSWHTREYRKLANECPAREHAGLISASIRAFLFKIYISLTTYIRSKLRTFRSDLSIINGTLLGQLYTSHVYLGFYPTDFHENLYLSNHAHSLQKILAFFTLANYKGTLLEELCALCVLSRLPFQRFCWKVKYLSTRTLPTNNISFLSMCGNVRTLHVPSNVPYWLYQGEDSYLVHYAHYLQPMKIWYYSFIK